MVSCFSQRINILLFHGYKCCLSDTLNAAVLINFNAAPVIIFCRSGRRAVSAKATLEQKGYTNVINAGGLTDLINALASD
jgi:rhodanese-related sulfurtransferase